MLVYHQMMFYNNPTLPTEHNSQHFPFSFPEDCMWKIFFYLSKSIFFFKQGKNMIRKVHVKSLPHKMLLKSSWQNQTLNKLFHSYHFGKE